MEETKHKAAAFTSAKGTAGDVIMDRRPDGRWTFCWWCPMPSGNRPAEFSHGNGFAGTEAEAIDLARKQADDQGR
ncbi:MAG: hypothetical protein ACE37F_00950 [Nannocystaceae bacterium]